MAPQKLISAVPATHTHDLSAIAHRGRKDGTLGRMDPPIRAAFVVGT